MNFNVTIKIPNKIFTIKNKAIRSPFKAIVEENDLKLIRSRIKYYGLNNKDFSIEVCNNIDDKKNDYSYIPSERKPDSKNRKNQSSTSSSPTIKVSNKTKVEMKPVQKIINDSKPSNYKIQETILSPEKLFLNTPNSQEQNINDNIKNTEVKIEELSIKASTILDRFLNSEV